MCVYVCVNACIHDCMGMHMHLRAGTRVYKCVWCVRVRAFVCAHVCMYEYVCVKCALVYKGVFT